MKSQYLLNQKTRSKLSECKQFVIHYESKKFNITLNIEKTVADLIQQIKQKLLQLSSSILNFWLQSVKKHYIVDFLLNYQNQKISLFSNLQSFRVVAINSRIKHKRICLSDFIILKCLGKGSSGIVYLVRNKNNGKILSLKQIQKSSINNFKEIEQLLREKKIMQNYTNHHPFLLNLEATFESQNHLNFLMEFCPGGELFFHLLKRKFSQQQVKFYTVQLILAIEFLHQNNVIYRDLKPENVLIDIKGHIKLADFGCCKMNFQKTEFSQSFCGNLDYMAPEMMKNQRYNYAAQFFSIGSFIYQLMIGSPPQIDNLYFPQNISEDMKNVIEDLLESNPEKRLQDFTYLKQAKWFKNVNWLTVQKKLYKPPIKLNIKSWYIHNEFNNIDVSHLNNISENKYDRLFQMFEFRNNRNDQDYQKAHSNVFKMKKKKQMTQCNQLYYNQRKKTNKKNILTKHNLSTSTSRKILKNDSSSTTIDLKDKYQDNSIQKIKIYQLKKNRL